MAAPTAAAKGWRWVSDEVSYNKKAKRVSSLKTGILAIVVISAIFIIVIGRIDIPQPHYGDPARASSGTGAALPVVSGFQDSDWPGFARDTGGSQFSPLNQITPANVSGLRQAWVHHSGDFIQGDFTAGTEFETNPVIVENTLFYCTPFGRVFALDAATGKERWAFDPFKGANGEAALMQGAMRPGICRGVAYWKSESPVAGQKCQTRIFRGGAIPPSLPWTPKPVRCARISGRRPVIPDMSGIRISTITAKVFRRLVTAVGCGGRAGGEGFPVAARHSLHAATLGRIVRYRYG